MNARSPGVTVNPEPGGAAARATAGLPAERPTTAISAASAISAVAPLSRVPRVANPSRRADPRAVGAVPSLDIVPPSSGWVDQPALRTLHGDCQDLVRKPFVFGWERHAGFPHTPSGRVDGRAPGLVRTPGREGQRFGG